MNLRLNWKGTKEPTDEEIERDVAELRSMISRLDAPTEPHPAYYQNFLVRVRERVDEDRVRRRRWAPSVAWSSMTAAALVVVLAVAGVLPDAAGPEPGVRGEIRRAPNRIATTQTQSPYENGAESLMLSEGDVEMLDAILEKDEEAILRAMVESDNL
jgi:hypothetical protein